MPIFVPAADQFKVSPSNPPQNPRPDEERPEISPLPATGGFVVWWQGNYDPDFPGVIFQRFDANAGPAGNFVYNGSGGRPNFAMDVIALNDGTFWTFSDFGNTPRTISGLRYDSSGNQIGTFSITPPPTSGLGQLLPNSIVAEVPPQGGFILSWAHQGDRVYWRQFDNSGQALTPIMQIAPTPNTTPNSVSVNAFQGGGYAITYSEQPASGSNPPEHIILKTFDAQWQPVATVDIATRFLGSSYPTFHTDILAGDRLILVWSDASSVRAQLFNAQGGKIGNEILVSAETSPTVDVAAHPDGGFVISWTDPSSAGEDPTTTLVDDSFSSIKAQAFDASGNKVGDEILVNTVTAGVQEDQDIAILPNGDMVITWTTPEPGASATISDIAARLFHLQVPGPGSSFAGTGGDDVLQGTSGDDIIFGLGGNDQISGLAGADGLYGEDGDDRLISGSAGDAVNYLVGGPGNDEYIVVLGDAVVEEVGEGFDTIRAQTSFILNAFAEIELLTTTDNAGTASLFLVGNEFDQTLYGNAGNNYLDGDGGADILVGLGGNDAMMVEAGDTIVEAVGGGFDNVAARTSYVLASGAEVEVLSTADHGGTNPISLTGNAFAQSLIGNAGDNYLNGDGASAGGDVLQGRRGNDVMIVYPSDVVRENAGEGFDTVASRQSYVLTSGAEVEVLMTTDQASTQALNLTGNEFGQAVAGNEGVNQLDGKLGQDLLLGFGGADAFVFSARFGNDNIDSIGDMVSGVDRIWLSNTVFTGLTSGALPGNAFRIGASAQDADDRIIYDPATGNLLFDPDGTGSAVAQHFATLWGAPMIAASDFLVFGS